MRKDKFKAYKLRVQGRSYNEISRLLHVPKSTLSTWFAGLEIPEEAKERIKNRNSISVQNLIKRNRAQTNLAEKRANDTKNRSAKEISKLSDKDLKIAGISLYWAEGYKRPIIRNGKTKTYHPVSLTNSDPHLVRLFIHFLLNICSVPKEKIKASIRMFDHQDEAYISGFWQNITGIPASQFGKTYRGINISSQRKKKFSTLPFGTIQVVVADTNLYHKIMGWIEGLKNNFY